MVAEAHQQQQLGKRKTLDAFFKPSKKRAEREPEDKDVDDKNKESLVVNKPQSPTALGKGKGKGKQPEKPGSSEQPEKPGSSSSITLATAIPEDKRQDLRLELDTIAPSWLQHLQAELTKPYFTSLKQYLKQQHALGKKIYPPAVDLYSWSRFSALDQIKVVILGQDPYHGPNQAHGLAFSVRPSVRIPPSLLNMYKALERDFPGYVRPKHGYLRGWAEQGVLLLNAALTVEEHQANAHKDRGWEQFTDKVVSVVNRERQNVVFMLWGSYAQKKGSSVDAKKHLVLKSVHPSPLSASRGFFDAGHFKKANEYLRSTGQTEIDWAHLPSNED
ncbi:uracil DNA glycosylase [Coemansia sp. RSA 1722]|nr:uracil DNA glycosylase [Coemansia sp. RSA 485]KAJ2595006.1 uracil DNA glycosylase [Coemansia sp. RSA 1721]KAJ2598859.1 uracil DNA glycosylase [Coemansia sp. RSA 1722]